MQILIVEDDERLKKKLDSFSSDQVEITHLLKKTLTGLEHLSTIYESGALEEKRQILGSIFPENLVFDGIEIRTARLNEGVELIYQISSKITGQKKWDKSV